MSEQREKPGRGRRSSELMVHMKEEHDALLLGREQEETIVVDPTAYVPEGGEGVVLVAARGAKLQVMSTEVGAQREHRLSEVAQLAQATEHAETIAAMRARADQQVTRSQREVERLTANIGRPATIALLAGLICVWIAWNTYESATHHHVVDPPPFFWLQGAVALYAALVSTFVLATQNREKRHAEQRAYLELQINLLAEQKTAKIIELLEELRRDMPTVRDRVDHQANAMQKPVDTSVVMNAMGNTMDHDDEPEAR